MEEFHGQLYGIGASVVIVGALFKIQHWTGAGTMLLLVFHRSDNLLLLSLQPLHEEVDWTLVYPELAGIQEEEPGTATGISGGGTQEKISGGGGGGAGSGSYALSNSTRCSKRQISLRSIPETWCRNERSAKQLLILMSWVIFHQPQQKYMNTIHSANDALTGLTDTYQSTAK